MLSTHQAARKEVGLGNMNLLLLLHRAGEQRNFVLKVISNKVFQVLSTKENKIFQSSQLKIY